MNVDRILKDKGDAVCCIEPDATVYEALEIMAKKNIGALLVMQEDKIVGIITERDYSRKVILKGLYSKETAVHAVMTAEVCYVGKKRGAHECMALMTERRFRHLPVIDDGKLIGLVSMGDVVKCIIDEQDHEIADYENYIRGWY